MKKVFRSKIESQKPKVHPFQIHISNMFLSKELTETDTTSQEKLLQAGSWENPLKIQQYTLIEEKITNHINLKTLDFIGKNNSVFTRKDSFNSSKEFLLPFILKIIIFKFLILNSNEIERKNLSLDSFFERLKLKNSKLLDLIYQEMQKSNNLNGINNLLASNEFTKFYEFICLTQNSETFCEVRENNAILNYF